MDVRARAMVCLVALPVAVFFSKWIMLIFLCVILGVLITLSRIRLTMFWKNIRFWFIFSMVAFIILSLTVVRGSYNEKLLTGVGLSIRLSLFMAFGIIYALTTNPNEILQALIRMHVPHRFGILMMIGFRLYPLILRKVQTITYAAKARGINPSFSILRPLRSIKTLLLLSEPFIIATLETGVYLGETMTVRGYDPYSNITISPETKMKMSDYIWILGSVALSSAVVAIHLDWINLPTFT